jgi:ATP-dependent DNA ligase
MITGHASKPQHCFRWASTEVQFYAFDMLVSEAEDLRKLPLTMRKTNLARLLARRVDGSIWCR